MADRGRRVRAETRPQSWESLQPDQKQAVVSLVEFMLGCAKDVPRDPPRAEIPDWLEMNRSSRVAFLSGLRGSGKSTVLATLVRASSRREWIDSNSGVSPDLKSDLEDLQKRIVWLEPLDMEPHPEPMNLLAAILVRVQDALFQFKEQQTHEEPSTRRSFDQWLDDPEKMSSAQRQIDRQIQRVASAWDEQYGEVRSKLTPEDYRAEVLYVEKARLHLNRDLRIALRKADEELQELRRSRETSLFVLPIDDFDLNPTSCLHSLRLLRMLSIPSLFSLLVGDMSVLANVLQMKYASDFQKAYQRASLKTLPFNKSDLSRMAASAASNGLRKLLPPAQRVYLNRLSIRQGLEYLPVDQDQTMWKLLAKIRLPEGRTLREFLVSVDHPKTSDSKKRRTPDVSQNQTDEIEFNRVSDAAFSYTGLKLFSGTHRELTDLWHHFDGLQPVHSEVEEAPKTSDSVRDRLCQMLSADLAGNDGDRDDFFNSILDTVGAPASQVRIEMKADVGDSMWNYNISEWRLTTAIAQLRVRTPRSFRLVVVDGSAGDETSSLSNRAQGAISILSDLATLASDKHSWPYRVSLSEEIVWVSSDWRGIPGEPPKFFVPWPVPQFRTIKELDLFRFHWTKLIDEYRTTIESDRTGKPISRIAWCWVSACSAALYGIPVFQPDIKNWDNSWWKLLDGISNQAPASNAWPGFIEIDREWLTNLAVMLTPASGFVSDGFPAALWFHKPEHRKKFTEKCERISTLWKEQQVEICKRLTLDLTRICRGDEGLRKSLVELMGQKENEFGFFTSDEAYSYIEKGQWNFDPNELARNEQRQQAMKKSLSQGPVLSKKVTK